MRRFAELMVTFWRAAAETECARKAPDHVHYPLPTTTEITAGIQTPRLRVWRSPGGLLWFWRIKHPDGWIMEVGHHSTHAEALAVGLAALDAAHARTRR